MKPNGSFAERPERSSRPTMVRPGQALHSPEQHTRSLLAQRTAQLGQLLILESKVISGELVNGAELIAGIRREVEQANPGKTLDGAWRIVDTPDATKSAKTTPSVEAGNETSQLT